MLESWKYQLAQTNKQTKNLQQRLLSPARGPGMGQPSKTETFDK